MQSLLLQGAHYGYVPAVLQILTRSTLADLLWIFTDPGEYCLSWHGAFFLSYRHNILRYAGPDSSLFTMAPDHGLL